MSINDCFSTECKKMSHVPRTSVYLFTDEFMGQAQSGASESEYSQRQITKDDLLRGVQLKQFLGKGSYGATFLCTFQGYEFVIKIPVFLIKDNLIRLDSLVDQPLKNVVESMISHGFYSKYTPGRLHAMFDDVSVFKNRLHEAVYNFQIECLNAEAILEPPIYRYRLEMPVIAGEKKEDTGFKHTGEAMVKIKRERLLELNREMNAIHAHPGHAHLHPILHMDFEIPCILSTPAHGTLEQLVREFVNNSDPIISFESTISPFWIEIAKQIGSTLDYMQRYCAKVHADIKPDNILFKDNGNNSYHFWLCDFGLCCDKGVLHPSKNPIIGTAVFNPSQVQQTEWYSNEIPAFHLTIYQYMMTLISCIALPLRLNTLRLNTPGKEDRQVGVSTIQQRQAFCLPIKANICRLFPNGFPYPIDSLFEISGYAYQLMHSFTFTLESNHFNAWTVFLKLVFDQNAVNLNTNFNHFMAQIAVL